MKKRYVNSPKNVPETLEMEIANTFFLIDFTEKSPGKIESSVDPIFHGARTIWLKDSF